jgi:hypothetical protein
MTRLTIATWNINSLRLRQDHLLTVTDALAPDVLCLQETKVPDDQFPHAIAARIGLPHVLMRGMKSYNGVAIFSRYPLTLADKGGAWCGKNDCRHLAASLTLNGQTITIGSGANRETAVILRTTRFPETSIVVTKALTMAHMAGAQVSGTGITLAAPLTHSHAREAVVTGSISTPGAPNHYFRRSN